MRKPLNTLLYLLCAPLLLSLGACVTDPPTSPSGPSAVDFSDVDKLLRDSVPGAFNGKAYVMIKVAGKTVYQRGFGGYDSTSRELIASCSKWYSAAVLMSQVDAGKLKLSDTVGKFLPIFTTYHKGNITIAQLFSHTSGFPGSSDQGYESNPLLTLETAVNNIAKNVNTISPPGVSFYYGGVSMQIAGRICEVVSGKSWSNLAQATILGPCGMTQTDYGLTQNPIIAGGGRSTPSDYLRFLDMVLQQGLADNGHRVLSEASVAALEQSQTATSSIAYSPYPTALLNGSSNFYGIGNWLDVRTETGVLLETSSPGLYGSHPWINRSKHLSGLVFTYLPIQGYIATMPTCLRLRALVRAKVY